MSPTLATNMMPLTIMILLRPSQSASRPAMSDETMLPRARRADMIDVCASVRLTVLAEVEQRGGR